MSDDLIRFLRARFDDEERITRAADTGQPWEAVTGGTFGPAVRVDAGQLDNPDPAWSREVNCQVWSCDDEADGCPEATRGWIAEARHIARHDPARVLREVEAKRRLIDACVETLADEDKWDVQLDGGSGEEFALARWALRLLALPYSDRPGYREEWKP